MIFDQETLKIHIWGTITGVIAGTIWWCICVALFTFEIYELWMSVAGAVFSANLALISVRD